MNFLWFELSMVILIVFSLYNWSKIKPRWIVPRGYWIKHPILIIVYLLDVSLFLYALLS